MCIYQKFWKNVTLLLLIQIHTERAIHHLITKCCKKNEQQQSSLCHIYFQNSKL